MTTGPHTTWNDPDPEDEAAAGFFVPRSAAGQGAAPCPPPELVQASFEGVLPPELQERVARHVEGCLVCQALAEALDDSSVSGLNLGEHTRILTRIRSDVGSASHRFRWSSWRPMAAAAAALVIVALGSSLIWQSRRVPAPPAASETARDILLPHAPSVFVLEKPPIPVQGASDLLWRGSPPVTDDEVEALGFALDPYRADDFAEAARRLRKFAARRPQSAAGHFFLGVSELFSDRDAEAIVALESAERLAQDDVELASDAGWYLAYAYRRSGQAELAARKLDGLCCGQGSRAAQACAGLTELSDARSR